MDETSDDQTAPSSPAADTGHRTDAGNITDAVLVADDDLLIEEVSIDGMCGVY